jgi:hypothetical protein
MRRQLHGPTWGADPQDRAPPTGEAGCATSKILPWSRRGCRAARATTVAAELDERACATAAGRGLSPAEWSEDAPGIPTATPADN